MSVTTNFIVESVEESDVDKDRRDVVLRAKEKVNGTIKLSSIDNSIAAHFSPGKAKYVTFHDELVQ